MVIDMQPMILLLRASRDADVARAALQYERRKVVRLQSWQTLTVRRLLGPRHNPRGVKKEDIRLAHNSREKK
jgi:hypothetical protein